MCRADQRSDLKENEPSLTNYKMEYHVPIEENAVKFMQTYSPKGRIR